MTCNMIEQIEPYIPQLRRYARGLMRDVSVADDLVQDCLERAISRWSQKKHDSNPKPWLFAILHNLAMTRLQRQSKEKLEIAINENDLPSSPPSQEDTLNYDDIIRAMSLLTDDYRTILLLVSVDELTYAEAAQVLQIPIGTVMSRLSRAREQFHRILSRQQPLNNISHLRSVK